MPMNGRIDRQFVGDEYFNFISFININQRALLVHSVYHHCQYSVLGLARSGCVYSSLQ